MGYRRKEEREARFGREKGRLKSGRQNDFLAREVEKIMQKKKRGAVVVKKRRFSFSPPPL